MDATSRNAPERFQIRVMDDHCLHAEVVELHLTGCMAALLGSGTAEEQHEKNYGLRKVGHETKEREHEDTEGRRRNKEARGGVQSPGPPARRAETAAELARPPLTFIV